MGKASFPIKTAIAAWWMVGLGILSIMNFIRLFTSPPREEYGSILGILAIIFFGPILIVSGIVFLINSLLLFLKSKLGWWLSIVTILPFGYFVLAFLMEITFYPLPFVITPFILLLIDRKNFWKIASW
jgi:hypothetical protein